MQKINLTKQFIEENLIRSDGILNSRKLHLYTVDGINKLDKYIIAEAYTETKRPKCSNPDCDNLTSIITWKEGFRKSCSNKCACLDSTRTEKIRTTVMINYGVDNIFKSDKVKKTIKTKNEKTRKEKGIWIPGVILSDFREYKRLVYNITRNQNLQTLKNHNKLGYQLDHKYSIWYGFHQNIPPIYIGDINNLEYLTEAENKAKSVNCSIFLGDLKVTL